MLFKLLQSIVLTADAYETNAKSLSEFPDAIFFR